MGRIDKGVNCSVVGCSEKAIRSISSEDASQAKLNTGDAKRAYLCKTHYKELKKHLRKTAGFRSGVGTRKPQGDVEHENATDTRRSL